MKKIGILISFILLHSFNSMTAQNVYSEGYLDTITYDLLMKSDNKALIKIAKKGLRNGTDFFYLRYRLGIAQYNLKRYEAALNNFEVAFKQNPYDPLLKEYLYYTFVLTGRGEEADAFASKLPQELQEKIKWKNRFVKYCSIGSGVLINQNNSKNRTTLTGLPANTYGKSDFNENIYYGSLGTQLNAAQRLRIPISIQYYNTTSGVLQYTPRIDTTPIYHESQFQSNIGFFYNFKKDVLVGLVGNYYLNHNDGINSILIERPKVKFDSIMRIDKTYVSFSGSVILGKRFKSFYPKISFTLANFIDSFQYQFEPSITLYPFGNYNFYSISAYSYQQNQSKLQHVISQKFGGKIIQSLWYEVSGKYGNLNNYITDQGYSAYNSFDPILFLMDADLNIYIKKIQLQLGYGFQIKEGTYTKLLAPPNGEEPFQYKYNNHLFKLTFICRF